MSGLTNASKRQHGFESEKEEANKRRVTTTHPHEGASSDGMASWRPSRNGRRRSRLTYDIGSLDDYDEEAERARLAAVMAEARRRRDMRQQGQQRQEAQRQRQISAYQQGDVPASHIEGTGGYQTLESFSRPSTSHQASDRASFAGYEGQHNFMTAPARYGRGDHYTPLASSGHSQPLPDDSRSPSNTYTVGVNSGIPVSYPQYATHAYAEADDFDDHTLLPLPNELIHGEGAKYLSQEWTQGGGMNRQEQSGHSRAERGGDRFQNPFAAPGSGAQLDTIRQPAPSQASGHLLHMFAASTAPIDALPKTKSQQKKEQDEERGIVKGTDGKGRGEVRTDNGILEVKIDHVWKPAAYHHERRKELLRMAEALCSYNVKPIKGHDALDRIAPHPWYKSVSMKERSMRSWVLYLWDPPNGLRPAGSGEPKDYMRDPYDDNKILIDINNHPIRDFPELPAILTGQLDGTWIELFRRLNRHITLPDIFARTPPTTVKGVGTKRQSLTIQSYGNRARRDRILLGTRAWQEREGSDGIAERLKQAMPNRVLEELEAEGSTSSWRDLTNKEIDAITAINHSKGSAQSRAGNKALDPVTKKARDEIKNAKEGEAFRKLLEEKVEEDEKDSKKQGGSMSSAAAKPRKYRPTGQQRSTRSGTRMPQVEDPAEQSHDGYGARDFSGIASDGEAAEGGWNDSTLLDDPPTTSGEASGQKTMTEKETKEFEDFIGWG